MFMHLVIHIQLQWQMPHCGDERSVAKYLSIIESSAVSAVAGRGEMINTESSYLASPDCSHSITSHLILLHQDHVTV